MSVMKKQKQSEAKAKTSPPTARQSIEAFTKPTTEFTRALAEEIVKGLTSFGKLTTRPFARLQAPERSDGGQARRDPAAEIDEEHPTDLGEHPILVDTSVLIDGRILPIVNSGFLVGTLVIPQFVLGEVQHIADSSDSLRRAKGRRGLDIANKLKGQKVNSLVKTIIIGDDVREVTEVDHKLVAMARRRKTRLLTVDFNLASLARSQGVKVLNVNDMAQALKVMLQPGEEVSIKITHEGKEREQGVGYLEDGTMVVVEHARDRVGQNVVAIVTKVHQTPAGQLFFARLK